MIAQRCFDEKVIRGNRFVDQNNNEQMCKINKANIKI